MAGTQRAANIDCLCKRQPWYLHWHRYYDDRFIFRNRADFCSRQDLQKYPGAAIFYHFGTPHRTNI